MKGRRLARFALALLGACSSAAEATAPPGGGSHGASDGGDASASSFEGGASEADRDAAAADAPTTPATQAGVLIGGPGPWPGAIGGLDYRSGHEHGTTDANGTFRYEAGATVTFSIAGVDLGTVAAAPKLSPFALAGGPCAVSDALRRVLVTLETLDDDAAPETGIHLAPITAPPNETRALAAMNEPDFATWIGGLTAHPLADASAALTRFVLQIDDETWMKTDETAFDSIASATRSQGVAWDGAGYVFSWTLGLQRTDANLVTVVNKPASIPFDLYLASGSNHIGDIDVFGGTLYAPLEDGSAYEHPTIVLFDAQTLDPKGPRFELPATLLTKGVPWIAVDGPRGVAYVAEWDPTPSILVFDLATFTHQRSIPLSTTLGRIQGAKVLDGALYASSDDDDKTLYKIDLDTGIVLPPLFRYGASVVKELEGFALVPGSGGDVTMHVLAVDAGGSSVTFRTHARTRAPIRSEVCAP
jgi:hypothetical protein